jgi:hypothetical protein
MKTDLSLFVPCVLAGVVASSVCAAGSFSIQVQNKCDAPITYKIEGSSTLQSTLGSRTSSTVSVDEGDKVIYNGTTVHTVSAASKDSTVVLCNK